MSKAMKEKKQALIPRLRFPEFRNAGEWHSDLVKNLVSTVTPPKKLTSDLYEGEGRFPVIDQSQEYICGWTNDKDALVYADSPLIVFGDHTCVLKIVDQPFAQGADGIKILEANEIVDPTYIYQYLLFSPVSMENYKRHFSTLKEKLVLFPDKETGEQQKLSDCLSSLDALIAAQAEKIDALKAHKKGLMQKLFPRDGETVPRLRFSEFRTEGGWEERLFEEFFLVGSSKRVLQQDWTTEGVPFYRTRELVSLSKNESFTSEVFISEKLFSEISEKYGLPTEGDFLVSGVGTLGIIYQVRSGDRFYFKDGNVLWLKLNGDIVSNFFKYCFQSDFIQNQISGQASVSTVGTYTIQNAKQTKFLRPVKTKEQQKVADCLSSLDDLIDAHTEKLYALKAHKKGLMQQLFPSPEAVGA